MTLAELALLSGVSSNAQTQLTDLGNDKEDSIAGAATSVTSANLTSNRVLLSDGNGKISASGMMTDTTFSYLDPTSSIQSQLDGKHPEITTSAPLGQTKIEGLADTDTSFNSEIVRLLFCLWAEIEITPASVQKMKDMITSKTFEEHSKGKGITARSCLSPPVLRASEAKRA